MRFLKNNKEEGYRTYKVKCKCGLEWSPYGKSGPCVCSQCGAPWITYDGKRMITKV